MISLEDGEDTPKNLLGQCLGEITEWTTELSVFSGVPEMIEALSAGKTDLVFLDFHGQGSEVLKTLSRVQALRPHCPVIVVTDKGSEETAVDVMRAGVSDYMLKRFLSAKSLKRAISNALEKSRLLQEIENHRLEIEHKHQELQQALARETEIGSHIQRELLIGPPPQGLRKVQVASLVIPAQSIGGDFCDFIPYGEALLDLIVGDVMGKGVPAALLGAGTISEFIRSMMRLMTASAQLAIPSPESIVNAVHRKLTPQLIHLESFVTLCYARFDLMRHKIQFVDCGHMKAIQYQKKTGRYRILQGTNMPLGISLDEAYRAEEADFRQGDIFLFHSDGLVETRNPQGELYGDARLAEWVCQNSALAPAAMIEALHAEISAYAQSKIFADDLTCIVIKTEPAGKLSKAVSGNPGPKSMTVF